MSIIPITPTEPACFGVVCPMHEHCARYHAAEGTPLHTIDSCQQGDERPLFVMLHLAEQGTAA